MNEFSSLMTQVISYQRLIGTNIANEKEYGDIQTVKGFKSKYTKLLKSFSNEDVISSMMIYVLSSYEPNPYDLVEGKSIISIEEVSSMLDRENIIGYKIYV